MNYLPTSLIFIGYSILTFIYVIKNRTEKIKNHLLLNEILIAILFLIAGLLFPFMIQNQSPLPLESLSFLWFLTSLIFLIEMSVWITTLLYNAIVSKKNPEIMAERDYNNYCVKVTDRWVDDFKSEFGRKFLHLFTTFVILFFWSLGTVLENLGILSQFNLDNYSFSQWLIITIGFGFVIMFQVADLTRLNKFYMLPNWAKRWFLSIRPEELNTFVASTPLVLSLIPFIFAPFEGFITGGVSSFLIVLIIMNLYHVWMPVSFAKILLMAIVSTVLFLLVDFFANHISDNILNPILTGFGMWFILLL